MVIPPSRAIGSICENLRNLRTTNLACPFAWARGGPLRPTGPFPYLFHASAVCTPAIALRGSAPTNRQKKNPTLPYGRDLWGPSCEVGALAGVSRSLPEGRHPTRAVFKHPSKHVGQRNNVYSRTRQGHVQLPDGCRHPPAHRSTCRAPQRFSIPPESRPAASASASV